MIFKALAFAVVSVIPFTMPTKGSYVLPEGEQAIMEQLLVPSLCKMIRANLNIEECKLGDLRKVELIWAKGPEGTRIVKVVGWLGLPGTWGRQ